MLQFLMKEVLINIWNNFYTALHKNIEDTSLQIWLDFIDLIQANMANNKDKFPNIQNNN